eukprot:TRINITY_DN8697_c0_g1_i1.p1 TRINITY_DN8697_c0_g1~~TRINITY_DN8697_c0_g1_i1.p1  ORF type:complete len:360 (-),score=59.92 TRINITY_DN8697_c0_g1_i1:51-1130(-)
MDAYNETKQIAEEAVIAANGVKGLRTVCLRPSGIFGPGDRQGWPGFIEAAKNGKSKFQLGNGKNMMDWTYVENVAYAHVLAAEKLQEQEEGKSSKDAPRVDGRVYFITNDEPIPFWDMAKYIWKGLDYPTPTINIPFWLAYTLAFLVDIFVWVLSPIVTLHPTFTKFRVTFAGANRYFSVERAKKELGYAPKVPLAEGMKITLKSFEGMRNPKPEEEEFLNSIFLFLFLVVLVFLFLVVVAGILLLEKMIRGFIQHSRLIVKPRCRLVVRIEIGICRFVKGSSEFVYEILFVIQVLQKRLVRPRFRHNGLYAFFDFEPHASHACKQFLSKILERVSIPQIIQKSQYRCKSGDAQNCTPE